VHSSAVVQWISFTSPDGFDFILMADAANRCFLFEAFFLDISQEIFTASSTVAALRCLPNESAAVIVTANGALTLVPSEPRTV
jgi:hypothetical protein